MTQEEKDLLLKDLCARLPYNIKASTKIGGDITIMGIINDDTIIDETEQQYDITKC